MTTSPRDQRTRVVITGMGAITPLGHTPEEFWRNLLAGKSGIAPVTLFDASSYKTRIAAEVKNFDATKYVDAKDARRMGRATLFVLAAAKDALRDDVMGSGPLSMSASGFVVSSSTVHDHRAGIRSGLPSRSTARTANVWLPTPSPV